MSDEDKKTEFLPLNAGQVSPELLNSLLGKLLGGGCLGRPVPGCFSLSTLILIFFTFIPACLRARTPRGAPPN